MSVVRKQFINNNNPYELSNQANGQYFTDSQIRRLDECSRLFRQYRKRWMNT